MFLCMRTTIDVSEDLLRRAKRQAAGEGTTLREVFEAALRAHLLNKPQAGSYRFRWRSERGRVMPGVRLDDRDALFDVMEGR